MLSPNSESHMIKVCCVALDSDGKEQEVLGDEYSKEKDVYRHRKEQGLSMFQETYQTMKLLIYIRLRNLTIKIKNFKRVILSS